jgi:xanthine dehydrogenase accessory factor
VAGSVSGGCIEDDMVDRVRKGGIQEALPYAVTYGVSADEARRFGLPCGGTIQLVIEPLAAHSRLPELLARLRAGELVQRTLAMGSGTAKLATAAPDAQMAFDGQTLVSIHGPRWRLLLIGGGQLSRFLAQMALGCDFDVTVCDPREEYTELWDVPRTRLVRTMPDDTVLAIKLDERCAVVALTHDPKLDDLALMEALKSPAFYVGALGSRSNNAKRRARLLEFGVTEAEGEKLHGPVGIYIGSRTPPEIAVSIMAQIIAAKNGVDTRSLISVGEAKDAAELGDNSGCVIPDRVYGASET